MERVQKIAQRHLYSWRAQLSIHEVQSVGVGSK